MATPRTKRRAASPPTKAPSGPASGFGRETTEADVRARIAWEKWAAKLARSQHHGGHAVGHELTIHAYQDKLDRLRASGARDASRVPTRRRSKTRTEWSTSLKYNIKDALEALHNAADMSDWAGVTKYVAQLRKLEKQLADTQGMTPARTRRTHPHLTFSRKDSLAQYEASERARARGRRGAP